jgi:hypothetical protein
VNGEIYWQYKSIRICTRLALHTPAPGANKLFTICILPTPNTSLARTESEISNGGTTVQLILQIYFDLKQ